MSTNDAAPIAHDEVTDKGVGAIASAEQTGADETTEKGPSLPPQPSDGAAPPEPVDAVARPSTQSASAEVIVRPVSLPAPSVVRPGERPAAFTSTLVGVAPPEGIDFTPGGERRRARDGHRSEKLEAGATFARAFRIVRRVAEDAGGTIYEATRVDDREQCLLRVIERAGVPDAARRHFAEDARVAGAPGAQHIVRVYDAGHDAATGLAWVATETVLGETLASHFDALGTGTAMPLEEAWTLLDQIAQGVASAHERGVAHRDLTPASVLLVPDSKSDGVTAKLWGFGLAHLRDPRRDEGRVFASGGAPLWIAPEQAASGDVTMAVDVWTLGLLAFRLLVGRSYWRVANEPEIELSELLSEMILEPRPAATVRAAECRSSNALPDGFDDWFARCVASDPESRFTTAEAAARALRSIAPTSGAVPVLDYSGSPSRPTIPIAPRVPRTPLAGSHVISADRDTIEPDTVLRIPAHAALQEVAAQRSTFDEAPTMRMRQLSPQEAGTAVISPASGAPQPASQSRPITSARPAAHASGNPPPQGSVRPEPIVDAMPAPAPPPPPRPPKSKLPAALALLVMGGACLFAVHVAAPGGLPGLLHLGPSTAPHTIDHTDPTDPTSQTPNPPNLNAAWVRNAQNVWQGRFEGTDTQLSFVLVLRIDSSGHAQGFFSWTITHMAGARVGEQVRENVEGTWEPIMGVLDLHGVLSTNPVLLPVNAYRLHVDAAGAMAGDTLDGASHLTASIRGGEPQADAGVAPAVTATTDASSPSALRDARSDR